MRLGRCQARPISCDSRCWYLAHAWVPFRRAFVAPSPTCELLGGSGGAGGWWGEGEVRCRGAAGCADLTGEVTPLSEKEKNLAGYQGEPWTVPTLKSALLVTSGRKYTKASAGQESGESGRAAIGRRAADARWRAETLGECWQRQREPHKQRHIGGQGQSARWLALGSAVPLACPAGRLPLLPTRSRCRNSLRPSRPPLPDPATQTPGGNYTSAELNEWRETQRTPKWVGAAGTARILLSFFLLLHVSSFRLSGAGSLEVGAGGAEREWGRRMGSRCAQLQRAFCRNSCFATPQRLPGSSLVDVEGSLHSLGSCGLARGNVRKVCS